MLTLIAFCLSLRSTQIQEINYGLLGFLDSVLIFWGIVAWIML